MSSPIRPAGTPKKAVSSPNRTVLSPIRIILSPSGTMQSPNRAVSSPNRPTLSPRDESSPNRPTLSPRDESSPNRPTLSPREESSPNRPTLSPRDESSPNRPTLSPRDESSPNRPMLSPNVTVLSPSRPVSSLNRYVRSPNRAESSRRKKRTPKKASASGTSRSTKSTSARHDKKRQTQKWTYADKFSCFPNEVKANIKLPFDNFFSYRPQFCPHGCMYAYGYDDVFNTDYHRCMHVGKPTVTTWRNNPFLPQTSNSAENSGSFKQGETTDSFSFFTDPYFTTRSITGGSNYDQMNQNAEVKAKAYAEGTELIRKKLADTSIEEGDVQRPESQHFDNNQPILIPESLSDSFSGSCTISGNSVRGENTAEPDKGQHHPGNRLIIHGQTSLLDIPPDTLERLLGHRNDGNLQAAGAEVLTPKEPEKPVGNVAQIPKSCNQPAATSTLGNSTVTQTTNTQYDRFRPERNAVFMQDNKLYFVPHAQGSIPLPDYQRPYIPSVQTSQRYLDHNEWPSINQAQARIRQGMTRPSTSFQNLPGVYGPNRFAAAGPSSLTPRMNPNIPGGVFCIVCMRNGEPAHVYYSHTTTNPVGQITCPTLLRFHSQGHAQIDAQYERTTKASRGRS